MISTFANLSGWDHEPGQNWKEDESPFRHLPSRNDAANLPIWAFNWSFRKIQESVWNPHRDEPFFHTASFMISPSALIDDRSVKSCCCCCCLNLTSHYHAGLSTVRFLNYEQIDHLDATGSHLKPNIPTWAATGGGSAFESQNNDNASLCCYTKGGIAAETNCGFHILKKKAGLYNHVQKICSCSLYRVLYCL